MDFRKMAAFFVLASFAYLFFAISAQAQAKLCDSEASFGRSDQTLFGKYCGVCHTISGRWKRIVSTPLGELFERKQPDLVTGQPVNEETVRAIIEKGGPVLMPGFQYTLTADQIGELVQFLKVARCNE